MESVRDTDPETATSAQQLARSLPLTRFVDNCRQLTVGCTPCATVNSPARGTSARASPADAAPSPTIKSGDSEAPEVSLACSGTSAAPSLPATRIAPSGQLPLAQMKEDCNADGSEQRLGPVWPAGEGRLMLKPAEEGRTQPMRLLDELSLSGGAAPLRPRPSGATADSPSPSALLAPPPPQSVHTADSSERKDAAQGALAVGEAAAAVGGGAPKADRAVNGSGNGSAAVALGQPALDIALRRTSIQAPAAAAAEAAAPAGAVAAAAVDLAAPDAPNFARGSRTDSSGCEDAPSLGWRSGGCGSGVEGRQRHEFEARVPRDPRPPQQQPQPQPQQRPLPSQQAGSFASTLAAGAPAGKAVVPTANTAAPPPPAAAGSQRQPFLQLSRSDSTTEDDSSGGGGGNYGSHGGVGGCGGGGGGGCGGGGGGGFPPPQPLPRHRSEAQPHVQVPLRLSNEGFAVSSGGSGAAGVGHGERHDARMGTGRGFGAAATEIERRHGRVGAPAASVAADARTPSNGLPQRQSSQGIQQEQPQSQSQPPLQQQQQLRWQQPQQQQQQRQQPQPLAGSPWTTSSSAAAAAAAAVALQQQQQKQQQQQRRPPPGLVPLPAGAAAPRFLSTPAADSVRSHQQQQQQLPQRRLSGPAMVVVSGAVGAPLPLVAGVGGYGTAYAAHAATPAAAAAAGSGRSGGDCVDQLQGRRRSAADVAAEEEAMWGEHAAEALLSRQQHQKQHQHQHQHQLQTQLQQHEDMFRRRSSMSGGLGLGGLGSSSSPQSGGMGGAAANGVAHQGALQAGRAAANVAVAVAASGSRGGGYDAGAGGDGDGGGGVRGQQRRDSNATVGSLPLSISPLAESAGRSSRSTQQYAQAAPKLGVLRPSSGLAAGAPPAPLAVDETKSVAAAAAQLPLSARGLELVALGRALAERLCRVRVSEGGMAGWLGASGVRVLDAHKETGAGVQREGRARARVCACGIMSCSAVQACSAFLTLPGHFLPAARECVL